MSSTSGELFFKGIQQNDSSIVQSLIDSDSFDVNQELHRDAQCGDDVVLPLWFAAVSGRAAIVEMLLRAGASIYHASTADQTACHAAASKGHADVVRVLLDWHTDLEALDDDEHTPLDVAIFNMHEAVTIMLIEAGAPLDNRTAVCHAAGMSMAVVQALIARGVVVDANLRSEDGATPLHYASTRTHDPALMHFLVNVCACDVDARHSSSSSCFHVACIYKNDHQLRWLIEAGADVDQCNELALTPLHFACKSQSVECVMLLLAAGARVDQRCVQDRMALHTAQFPRGDSDEAKMKIVHALLAADADCDAPSQSCATPRQMLADHGLSIDPAAVEAARREIARTQLGFVRNRAFQVCVGLQSLGLDALQLCEILVHACGPVALTIRFHHWWQIATSVKHFETRHKRNATASALFSSAAAPAAPTTSN
jgi:ankyrin repeat protein